MPSDMPSDIPSDLSSVVPSVISNDTQFFTPSSSCDDDPEYRFGEDDNFSCNSLYDMKRNNPNRYLEKCNKYHIHTNCKRACEICNLPSSIPSDLPS